MIEIDDKIVSADLLREYFACDLAACKGICCVEGNAGAPLEWTKSSQMLAFIRFDEKMFPPTLSLFCPDKPPTSPLSRSIRESILTNILKREKYNSKVSVHTFDIKSKVTRKINVPVDARRLYSPHPLYPRPQQACRHDTEPPSEPVRPILCRPSQHGSQTGSA
mgnify:CR=1 FL=1